MPWHRPSRIMAERCGAEDCRKPLIPKAQWYAGNQPAGAAPHGGKGLCQKHYNRLVRQGTTADPVRHLPGPRRSHQRDFRPAEEVLEDYSMIRREVDSVRDAAVRMGMTFSALDKALHRARKRGDDRGMPPPAQLDRADRNGSLQRYYQNRRAC